MNVHHISPENKTEIREITAKLRVNVATTFTRESAYRQGYEAALDKLEKDLRLKK